MPLSFMLRKPVRSSSTLQKDDRLVVLEILEASDFLAKLTKGAMQADGKRVVEV